MDVRGFGRHDGRRCGKSIHWTQSNRRSLRFKIGSQAVRLFLLFLLVLPSCSSESDGANEQVSLEHDKQQISESAVTAERTAKEAAAADVGVVAPTSALRIGREAEDVDVGVTRRSLQKLEVQTSGSAPKAHAAPAAPGGASLRSGRELVQMKCSTCHGLEVALAAPRSAANWTELVEVMAGHGMVASEAERRLMQKYLETCC